MLTFSRLGRYGRLGNQLFQIASTIGIARKNGHSYMFPEWEYTRFFRNPLPAGVINDTRIYRQRHPWYYDVTLGPGNWDLTGYFQSELFFKDAADEVRKMLTPSQEIEASIDQKYSHILKGDTCSIHVRRGDFVKFRHAFPPLTAEYYRTAIAEMGEKHFVFFSDDIEWCKKQFMDVRGTFIENESEITDLFLMSKCKSHIIANSSFSWWGAWLNPDLKKRVIAPSYWFGPGGALNYKKKNRSIHAPGFQLIQNSIEPGIIASFFIYLYSKTKYFIIYRAKNIIPVTVRRKLKRGN